MPLSHNPSRPDHDDRKPQVVDVVRPGLVWFLAAVFALFFIIILAVAIFG